MTRDARPLVPLALLAVVLGSGCVTERTVSRRLPAEPTPEQIRAAAEARQAAERGDDPAAAGDAAGERPTAAPEGHARSAHVLAQVQPRGTIPYDNMTLPIVSPDGRFIATQTGLPASWETILGEPGAIVPWTTRIEIFELPAHGNDPAELVATVEEPALLGRACDDRGFLVEAPQENGARWIGLASWETGAVRWLVADPNLVCAFASLGANGRLAYSERPVGGDHFDLVVRRGDEEWRLPAQGADWLMPTWGDGATDTSSDAENGLFALVLRGPMLDAVHMDALNSESMRRTIQRLPLANDGATIDVAYQTLVAGTVVVGETGPRADRLLFFHPARMRAAAWQPPGLPTLLDAGSIAAVTDHGDPDRVLVVTPSDLVRRGVTESGMRSKLIAGTHVPRQTTSRERPFILLRPADGVIGITVMQLLSPEQVAVP
jgi:hypothetical protein